MERQKERHEKIKGCLIKAFCISLLAFLLSFILVAPISFSATSIFSTPDKDDFTISDFYAQVANRRPTRVLDRDVVIIDIGTLDRAGIADLLSIISICGPRALGVDVMFEERMESDSLLLASLKENPGVVLPLDIEESGEDRFEIAGQPFFYKSLQDVNYGVVNLPGKFSGATIREFAVDYRLADGATVNSFPVEVAGLVAPEKVKRLKERGNHLEMIDYPSREFVVMDASEVMDRGEELTDKVVLVGAMDDVSDMHASPIDGYMSGVYIHALALSTILNGSYYTSGEAVADWVYAWLLCFLVTLVGLLVDARVKGLVTRVLQIILVYLAVQIGYYVFVEHRIVINFSYTLMMVTFGLIAADIWNGTTGLAAIIRERKERKRNKIANTD